MRELENLVKRMVILGTDAAIRRELADAIAGTAPRASAPIPALQHGSRWPRAAAAAPAAPAAPTAPAPAPAAAAPPAGRPAR